MSWALRDWSRRFWSIEVTSQQSSSESGIGTAILHSRDCSRLLHM